MLGFESIVKTDGGSVNVGLCVGSRNGIVKRTKSSAVLLGTIHILRQHILGLFLTHPPTTTAIFHFFDLTQTFY